VFKLATLFVDIVTNQGNFDSSIMSMRGALGPLMSLTQRMTEQGSDLIETMNKVDVAFGGSAGMVTSFANDMATQFGSVKNVTLDAASSFGLILQAAGLTKEESASFSIQLVKLADDMKSLYHIPLEDALRKIQAGLVGQARPLREYGVLLSAASVNQDLLAHGATRVHGQFSEQEKVMARLRIITDGLKVAQGDHAKTMGQYANQVDMLKGKMENYTTTIGAGVAGAEAKLMVNVVEKGIFSGLSEHAGEVWNQLFGDKNTSFQKGADIAAGLQVGLTKKMFENQAPPPEPLDYATEEIIAGLREERAAMDEMFDVDAVANPWNRMMMEADAIADKEIEDGEAHYAIRTNARRHAAEAENEFLRDFLDISPEAKRKKSKMSKEYEEYMEHPGGELMDKHAKYRGEIMGVADFAAKLRTQQRGGDTPEKQLTELQQIRKTEMEAARNIAKLAERGFPAVFS
jgi:hypothetical protein